MTLITVYSAMFAGYAYWHKDLKQDEKFTLKTADVKNHNEFFMNGVIPQLDFNKHIGMAAIALLFGVSGDLSTTIQ